jgi:8-oxo-dGTP pyrophosphatase MutT (NUDIX family)
MSDPRPASTVVLSRPAPPGLEIFLVRRHDNIAFMGGAHVFPGGRVDPSDHAADATAWCDGVSHAVTRMRDRRADEAIAFHVAAVRELFEEAGVLLARDTDGGFVRTDGAAESRFLGYRHDMTQRRLTLRALAEREGLRIALDALAMFAHWVTPDVETRRFDTHFFFAVLPAAQIAAHDQHETTEGMWIDPGDAIERCRRGEIALPPPTWTTLRMLSRFATTEEAWRWAQSHRVPRVQPHAIERGDGTRVVMLPGDPGCAAVDGFEAAEKRFLLENGRWLPIDPE